VAACPLTLTSPNAPCRHDILGILLLAVLAVHQRYAHITARRGDAVNAALLGMRRVMSEDSVRRARAKIDEAADPGGGGSGRQPACLKAFGTGLVGVVGAARPRSLAAIVARRL
jgi:hypothetical protein